MSKNRNWNDTVVKPKARIKQNTKNYIHLEYLRLLSGTYFHGGSHLIEETTFEYWNATYSYQLVKTMEMTDTGVKIGHF